MLYLKFFRNPNERMNTDKNTNIINNISFIFCLECRSSETSETFEPYFFISSNWLFHTCSDLEVLYEWIVIAGFPQSSILVSTLFFL